MTTAADRLLAHWQAQGAPIAEGLQPGLTDSAIDDLWASVGLPLPDELRALYRWRDGARESPGTWHRGQTMNNSGLRFVPLAALVEEHIEGWLPALQMLADVGLQSDAESWRVFVPAFPSINGHSRVVIQAYHRQLRHFSIHGDGSFFNSVTRVPSLVALLETWLMWFVNRPGFSGGWVLPVGPR